jgi:hypothetical protein
MAIVTLWMGIGSTFITKRTAAASQDVIDQVEPQRAYEVKAPNAAPQLANRNSSIGSKAASSERLGTR